MIKEQTITFSAEHAEVYSAPRAASKFIPDWYKKLPNTKPNEFTDSEPVVSVGGNLQHLQTMKPCVPVQDYLTSGYIIPLWADLAVQQNKSDFGFSWKLNTNSDKMVELHGTFQIEGANFLPQVNETTKNAIPKLMSPWRIKTPAGYSCLFFSPRYSVEQIEILPAVVDTDKYHDIHFPFILHKSEKDFYTIHSGTPIVQVLPFKRDNWNCVVEAIDSAEVEKERLRFSTLFHGIYKKLSHSPKKFR